MKLIIEQCKDSDAPYVIRLEIINLTVDHGAIYNIPVFEHQIGEKRLYNTEVCGFRVEADKPTEVVSLVEKLLPGLVNMGRFPTYLFIARRSHRMYPVYTVEDEVFATTPGGPVFRHVELAKVREYLGNYLHTTGELGIPGKSDRLHVRGVRKKSLALVRPIFYLKKRASTTEEDDFWAPVFVSNGNDSIYTYAASDRRQVDLNMGHEVLRLRSQVAQVLIADKRLRHDYDLRADRLMPDVWEKVKSTLLEYPHKLKFNETFLNMYQGDKAIIAVEHRQIENRYNLFLGENEDDLRDRVAKDFVRRGLVGIYMEE